MDILNLLAIILIVYAIFMIFGISFMEFIKDLKLFLYSFFEKKEKPIAIRVKEAKNPKQLKGFRLLISDAKNMLVLSGNKFLLDWILFIAIMLALLGFLIGIILKNIFIAPVLALALFISPYIYVFFMSIRWQKKLVEELETSLSIITTAYIRSNDIVGSIKENLDYLSPNVKKVFNSFVIETTYINSNTKGAIRKLREKINNDIFREWCDILILCMNNSEQKTALLPVVAKLSNMRVVTEELSNIIYEPLREYIIMMFLYIINLPMLRILNKEWFNNLTTSTVGKITLTVTSIIVLLTIPKVIAQTKEVSYKEK